MAHLAVRREKQAGDAAVHARGGAVGFLRDVTADDAVFLQTQAASNFCFFFLMLPDEGDAQLTFCSTLM